MSKKNKTLNGFTVNYQLTTLSNFSEFLMVIIRNASFFTLYSQTDYIRQRQVMNINNLILH